MANDPNVENADAQAQLLVAGTIARARADAIAVAARAQLIGRDPSVMDWLLRSNATVWDSVIGDAGHAARLAAQTIRDANPLGGISDAAAAAAATADTIATTIKWVGIVFIVIVGALIALWMIVLLTGAKWALGILGPIAPDLARAAARGAVAGAVA